MAALLVAACSTTGPTTAVPDTGSGTTVPDPTTTDPNANATAWTIDDLDWPTNGPGFRYQRMTLTLVGDVQLALAGPANRADGTQSTDTDVWRSTDGVHWAHLRLPTLVDGVRTTPSGFDTVVVDGDTVYAVALNVFRVVDPGLPDGAGQRAEPSGPVGAVWWSTDAGITWQRASEMVVSRFDSAALVDGTLWIGGALGDYPTMTAATWTLEHGTLVQRGSFGEPAEFSVTATIDDVDGAPVVGVAEASYAVTQYRYDGTTWAPTDVETPPYGGTGDTVIDLGLDGQLDERGAVLDDGTTTFVRGGTQQHHDLRFCFVDAATCRQYVLALAFRPSGTDDPWRRLALPDGFQTAYYVGPVLVGDHLIVYETNDDGVPTRRATLDLTAGPPPVVTHDEPPPLPAPEFDGTLEAGTPEAAEVVWACGGSYLTVNGIDMSARDSLMDAASTDWVQLRIDSSGSEGPVQYFYGLLELQADGRVEFRATTGQHIGWFDTAIPPEYYCG